GSEESDRLYRTLSEGATQESGNELSQVIEPAAVLETKFVSLGVAPRRNELDLLETHRTLWPHTADKSRLAPLTTRRGTVANVAGSRLVPPQPFGSVFSASERPR